MLLEVRRSADAAYVGEESLFQKKDEKWHTEHRFKQSSMFSEVIENCCLLCL